MKSFKQFLQFLLEDYISDWKDKQRKAGNLTPDNEAEHEEVLNQFKKEKQNLPINQRSLSAHKNIQSIQNAFEKVRELRSSSSLQARHDSATSEEKAGAETIHDKNGLQVQHIKTKAASCHYGKGTKWCTSAKKGNLFDSYNNTGNFYIVHGKDEKGKSQRYGIHFEKGESQNEANEKVPLTEIVKNNPELKNVEAFQGKHPATTSDENFEKHFDSLLMENPYDTINDDRLSENHIDKLMNSEYKNYLFRSKHVKSGKINAKHINDVLTTYSAYDVDDLNKYKALGSPHVKPEHINNILKTDSDADYSVKLKALESPFVKPEHIDNILSKTASEFKNIHKDYQDAELKSEALKSPFVKPKHVDNILNNPHEDRNVQLKLLYDRKDLVKPEHINNILKTDSKHDNQTKIAALQYHPDKVTSEHLHQILSTTFLPPHIIGTVRDSIRLLNLPKEQEDKKVEEMIGNGDRDISLRIAAAKHPNATKEHLQTALNDISQSVRNVAKNRLDTGDFKK